MIFFFVITILPHKFLSFFFLLAFEVHIRNPQNLVIQQYPSTDGAKLLPTLALEPYLSSNPPVSDLCILCSSDIPRFNSKKRTRWPCRSKGNDRLVESLIQQLVCQRTKNQHLRRKKIYVVCGGMQGTGCCRMDSDTSRRRWS